MRFICSLFAILTISLSVRAQEWETYESHEHHIQWDVPSDWATKPGVTGDVPWLESESPDGAIALYVMMYKDETITTEQLLDQSVENLGIKLKGEANEENINGLHAWVAEATGKIEGAKMGVFIMAATYAENNYVAYIFTEAKKFERNAPVMNKILDSFRPIR